MLTREGRARSCGWSHSGLVCVCAQMHCGVASFLLAVLQLHSDAVVRRRGPVKVCSPRPSSQGQVSSPQTQLGADFFSQP